MSKKERLVVIGNGMAGVATVENILTKRKDMSIAIFGAEPYTNYNRVLLSSVLSGEVGLDEITLNPQKWYEENGIELHLDASVKKINKKEFGIFHFVPFVESN